MGQYYKVMLGDENGNNKEVYNPWNYRVNGQNRNGGMKLMEHGFLGDLFSLGISRKITEKYKRVIWIGDYANGLTPGHDDGEETFDGELPYYARVSKNVLFGVKVPTYEEAWPERKNR